MTENMLNGKFVLKTLGNHYRLNPIRKNLTPPQYTKNKGTITDYSDHLHFHTFFKMGFESLKVQSLAYKI